MPKRTKDLDKIFNGDNGVKAITAVKVLRLNTNESILDSNSVQLPCIAEYQGKRYSGLDYEWYSRVNGKTVKRGIFVSGHGEYGIPTLRDLDTLIALQSIFISKKTQNGICELKTENIIEEDLLIDFTVNELARELGYESPSNYTRDLIKKSIEILVATTIFNRQEGGIYDVRNKRYIKDPRLAYHYIESYLGYETIVETEGGPETIIDVTKIKMSSFFYDMIVNNYKLYYNRDLYKKVKNFTARKIYLLAIQWMGNRKFSFARIETLVARVPMAQSEMAYKKQYIKKALKLLDRDGLLKIFYDKTDRDLVYMCLPSANIDENEIYYLGRYNTYDEIVDGLSMFDILQIEIPTLFDIEKMRYMQALLRYGSVLLMYNKIKDKREWIKSFLENEYPLDDKYYNQEGM